MLRKKKRVVIGIHGIGNKPPQPLLQKWWRRAICEGLNRIRARVKQWNFELVYWAQFLYSDPQDPGVRQPEHPLYISNPYAPAKARANVSLSGKWRKRFLKLAELCLDWMFLTENHVFNFDRISDYVVRKKFTDMAMYYDKNNAELGQVGLDQVGIQVRNRIREELARVLRKHRRSEILIVSHSMGTIIAYDVLTYLTPEIKVDTLVTLGSPLGLPNVMKQIYSEMHKSYKEEKILPTPENIQRAWLNFSDLRDPVATNYNLSDDFGPNSRGIKPKDVEVENDYEFRGSRNRHKSYGYLRSPEVARVIEDFLTRQPASPIEQVRSMFRNLMPRKRPELAAE